MTRVRRAWVGCAIAVVVLAGCRVDTRVEVTVRADGHGVLAGTVALDGDALTRLGGLDAVVRDVRLADLRRAGWQLSPWARSAGGGATLTASHAFRGQDDLAARLADLVGPHGIVRDPRLAHDHGWFGTHDSFSLVVDLRAPSAGLAGDADLRARLAAAGIDVATLDRDLTAQLRGALRVSVVVHLPHGRTRTYDAPVGTLVTMRASASRTDYDAMVKVGIAVALGLLAGAFVLAAAVGARRDRRRRAQRRGTRRVEPERAPLM